MSSIFGFTFLRGGQSRGNTSGGTQLMDLKRSKESAFNGEKAFTLVELLTVLAIMAVLILLIAPSLKGLMGAYQLTVTGQAVVSQLTLARQTALARNHAVQVRFYKMPDYNQSVSAAPAVFRGIQCFLEEDVTSIGAAPPVTALTKLTQFAAPVIGSTNANSSSLLAQTALAADPTQSLPSYAQNYNYVTVRFRSGGGTNLTSVSPGVNNCVTFILENDTIKDTANNLPSNYLTLTIDPVTGNIQSYRP